jgi:sorbitol-specific phosphotransferase system component IIBC
MEMIVGFLKNLICVIVPFFAFVSLAIGINSFRVAGKQVNKMAQLSMAKQQEVGNIKG